MIDKSTYDKLFRTIYTSEEASKIAQIVEKLEYVFEVIPIDAIPMEIMREGDSMYFYDGDIKVILPINYEVTNQHTSDFFQDYKIVEDGKYAVSKEYEKDENFTKSVIDTLKTFGDLFESGLVTKSQYKVYESLIELAENMISARFSENVLEVLKNQNNLFKHSNSFEVDLYAHQTEVYESYKNNLANLVNSNDLDLAVREA